MRLRTIFIVGLVLWGALAAIAALAFAIRPVAATTTPRTLSATVPVADHAELDLTAAVGNVDVRASADPAAKAVDVRVDLRAKGHTFWWGGPVAEPYELGLVVSEASGRVVRLHVGGGFGEGPGGELDRHGAGQILSPSETQRRRRQGCGPGRRHQRLGRCRQHRRRIHRGAIRPCGRSDFGRERARQYQRPGRRGAEGPGPSSRVRTSGDGTVPFTLSVNVGDAHLRIR